MPSARSQIGSVAYDTPRSIGTDRFGIAASPYVTPNSSARASDFMAVYEDAPIYDAFVPPSRVSSARTTGNAIVDGGYSHGALEGGYAHGSVGKRIDTSSVSAAPTVAALSLDPKQVFSAARHDRHKDVEKSLKSGFDPLSVDSFGNSLFHIACQNGNKRVAKLAIKYGGDMDAQNSKGNTGLHFLFAYGYPDIAEYFIEKGADENVQNSFGLKPREGIKEK